MESIGKRADDEVEVEQEIEAGKGFILHSTDVFC